MPVSPSDPSLRRGHKTSEFLLTAVAVVLPLLGSLLVLLDAIAPSLPPQYGVILTAASSVAAALATGLYSLGRSLAKSRAAASIPEYLNALENSRVNSFNIDLQQGALEARQAAKAPDEVS